jgi:hypothetical protein
VELVKQGGSVTILAQVAMGEVLHSQQEPRGVDLQAMVAGSLAYPASQQYLLCQCFIALKELLGTTLQAMEQVKQIAQLAQAVMVALII